MDRSSPPVPHGAIIKCVSFAAWGSDIRDGMLVVAQQTRDAGQLVETTIKRVRQAEGGINLVPESSNPRHKPLFIPISIHHQSDDIQVSISAIVLQIIFDLNV
jgi:SOS-response transcriptional repressor LexA